MSRQQIVKSANALLANMGGNVRAPSRAVQRAYLQSDQAYGMVLTLLVYDQYGLEFLKWAPETIRLELQDDFQLQVNDDAFSRLMAAVTILTSNLFYKDTDKFIQLCNIFTGGSFDPEVFDPADAVEILWGVLEASLIRPPDDDSEFTPAIREYMRQAFLADGLVSLPAPFNGMLLSDTENVIRAGVSDDPEMFAATWKMQGDKQNEIRQTLLDNLRELYVQLDRLPLSTGKADDLLQQLDKISTTLSQRSSGNGQEGEAGAG